jgi:hypothetical protein
VLFYATDDDVAAAAAEQLIGAAGFEPLKAGRVADAGRLEVPGGDLHQNGGLNGRLLDLDQARAAVEATEVTTWRSGSTSAQRDALATTDNSPKRPAEHAFRGI